MTSLFQCELLNQPFGDPALYVRLAEEKKALLFDLGNISSFKTGKLIKVTHVFVSHTHIDHFIGFDHMVRLNLARDKKLYIYGPEGIAENVKGKLQGYTWNLVDDYPFVIEVVEICKEELRRQKFFCDNRFVPQKSVTEPFESAIDKNPHYSVKAIRIDHLITSIAYSIEERFHININSEKLQKSGLPPGKWLRELKDCIWEGKPDSTPVSILEEKTTDNKKACKELLLGELKKELVAISRGQKIVYVSDCRGTIANFNKIISFASEADILYCEAAFLEKDKEKAAEKGHLTARQAGMIAREANVRKLNVFHFSPRYEHCSELLYREAEEEFRKT